MKITRHEAISGRLDADHDSHAPSRSLAAWSTRRAKALRIGVFDKRDLQYRAQSILHEIVRGSRRSMGDEASYRRAMLETRLADIESLALPILTNWCEGPPRVLRNDRQLVVVSAYLAIVHAQLPTISEEPRGFDTAFAEEHVRSSEELLRVLSSARTDLGPDEGTLSGEIRRALGEDDVRIEIRPNEAANLSLHVPEVAFRAFRVMRWRLAEASTDSEFITSDAPVNVFVPDGPSLGLDKGLTSPNAEVTFPVSPRMCLIGRRAGARGGERLPVVREVNQRQARAAERFVYFRQQTGAVEKVMKSVGKVAQPRTDYDPTHVEEFGALLIRGVRPSPARRMSS